MAELSWGSWVCGKGPECQSGPLSPISTVGALTASSFWTVAVSPPGQCCRLEQRWSGLDGEGQLGNGPRAAGEFNGFLG